MSSVEDKESEEKLSPHDYAYKHLKDKRDFKTNLVSYVVVNAAFVGIWAVTGKGYFWPIWIMALWGIGLVMHAWTVYVQRPITEVDVQREMRKLHPS